MNVQEENICRLCLNVVENGFEIIDEITKELFEVLLLRMNLDISKDPLICENCAEVAIKCFNFKSICIDTEEIIFSFAINQNRAKFELKDLYRDEKGIETVDDNFVCRFCLNYLSRSNFVLMNDVPFAEMSQNPILEMDLNVVKNPAICTSCRQNLVRYNKFVENCLDVEEKISEYLQNKGTPSNVQIKLSEILHFSSQHILESDYTQMRGIKQEEDALEDIDEPHSEVFHGELVKEEEALDIKDEEINLRDSSSTPTTSDYRMCMCGTIYNCIKCDMTSNKTGLGKADQRKCKGKINKKKHLILNKKNISEAKNFSCAMCTYQAKQKIHLKTHMLTHKDITEVEMYKCSMCTYQSKRKNHLKTHMLTHKDITEVEMYKCSMCTYQAKEKGYLKRHILIHKDITEVKMYKCSMCTYQAKQKGHLKTHMLTHKDITEVEMYKCSMCTYQAKEKGYLKRHILIHKDITEVRMYKCSMCTYQAKQKRHLKSHMLIHKDITEVEMYKCSMCTYQSRQKGNLKTHMLIHKDVKEMEMYKCSMCTYQAKQKGHLKTHMLIHKDITEVELYKCSMCTYQAKQE